MYNSLFYYDKIEIKDFEDMGGNVMGITCCICGKRQSGWSIDYPLSRQMSNFRICGDCNLHCTKISEAKNADEVKAEIKYIKSKLETNEEAEQEVIRFCNNIFNQYLTGFDENKTVSAVNTEINNKIEDLVNEMMITTGFDFQGYKITKYFDYVASETVLGLGTLRAIAASASNMLGTSSPELSSKIEKARKTALKEMKEKAAGQYGANAIIGVDIDFTMFGDSMIAVIANGTAVYIEKEK